MSLCKRFDLAFSCDVPIYEKDENGRIKYINLKGLMK